MTKAVLLGDICDVRDGTHDSPKPKDIGHPLVTSKHIKDFKIDFSSANFISDEDFNNINKRSKVDKYDILISMIGTVGELAFIDYEPTFAIKNIGLIKTGDELLGRYLFYYLQGQKAKEYIEASLAGSTQKFIGLGLLRKFPVGLPDKAVQQQIVDILRAIDDKIELNRKMNETLEQMGQALFRHYFIDNSDVKKWQSGNAGELFSLTMGLSPKGESYNEDGNGVPLLNGAADFTGSKITPKRWTSSPTRISKIGDIIFCIRGTIGNVAIGYDNYCLGRGVAAMTPKKNTTSYIYFSTINAIGDMESTASGSVIRGLSKPDISGRKIAIPSGYTLKDFEAIALPIIDKLRINSEEIQTLVTLRDTLLPRLINGKTKV